MKNAADMIMKALKRVDARNLDVKHIVIVPDRASLEAERQLLNVVGGSFNIRVLTFRRYANMLLPQYKYMSKQSALIVLSGIIADNKRNLRCYTKGVDNTGFCESIYNAISSMKYCNITPDQLRGDNLPQGLADKLQDIALLYEQYESFLATGYVDSSDKLRLLCDKLATEPDVANTYYYLYDFDNFTAQELALIQNLARYGKGVTVACCADDAPYKRYLYDNEIFNGVLKCAERAGQSVQIVEEQQHVNAYTKQIGEGVYAYKMPKRQECGDFVEIFEGVNSVQEVYAFACRVHRYVRQGGRYRDIYAVTSDVNKYYNAIVTVFEEFGIPYFCDKQVCLADQAAVAAIVDCLNMFRNNMQLGSILSFAKNVLIEGNEPSIYDFENYCLKYNVNYSLDAFKLGKDQPNFATADKVRARLCEIVNNVPIKQQDSARSYVDSIRQLVEQSNLWSNNQLFAQKQAQCGMLFESKTTLQVEEKLNAVLIQIEEMLGDRAMKLDDFVNILSTAAQSVKISVLPVVNDCVVFANMAKARKHDIKFLALLGANHSFMPIIKGDNKLLSDTNMQQMQMCGIDLQPLAFTENKRERFSLYQLLQEPSQKLYVSYSATEGRETLLPSLFVTQLAELFSVKGKPLQKTDSADEQVYAPMQALAKLISSKRRLQDRQPVKMDTYEVLYQYMQQDVNKYLYDKQPRDMRIEGGEQLFLHGLSTSVTRITDFYSCPYKFYMRYGVNIQPREVAQLQSNNLGDILHAVLEQYVKNMDLEESDEVTKANAQAIFNAVMQDDFYQGLNNDATMQTLLRQLKNEACKMCLVVKGQLKTSDFVNYATELTFGMKDDKKGLRGVKVQFGDNKVVLRGKIDRVDVCGNHFVVIDYKSGAAASKYTEQDLYFGHKLQLLVYLKAVIDGLKLQPFGFYYFNMHNNFVKEGEAKAYRYNGRTLDNVDIACKLDNNLATKGNSEKLGVSLKKDHTFDKRGNNILTASQLDAEIEYALRLIAYAGTLMKKGYIAVNPSDKACEYCDYKAICDFGDIFTYEPRTQNVKVTAQAIQDIVDSEVEQ